MLLRVRRARLEAGVALATAALKIGVAPQALSRVESGREWPWPALRTKLADLYAIDEAELFADIDEAREHLRRIAGGASR